MTGGDLDKDDNDKVGEVKEKKDLSYCYIKLQSGKYIHGSKTTNLKHIKDWSLTKK